MIATAPQEMLKDEVRTLSYRDSIINNKVYLMMNYFDD